MSAMTRRKPKGFWGRLWERIWFPPFVELGDVPADWECIETSYKREDKFCRYCGAPLVARYRRGNGRIDTRTGQVGPNRYWYDCSALSCYRGDCS